MKKRGIRLLSLLLSVMMVLGMFPGITTHVHAAGYEWNENATMTLMCGGQVVEPKQVIETADTKLKVYTLKSTGDYRLTTSADNDYAVLFEVEWSVIEEDEYGWKTYDVEMSIVLDNVTIRTRNPRADGTGGRHAAMMFSDENWERRYGTLEVELVGENTVELLGVRDDSEEERWSAAAFVGPFTCIGGSGTLNAACRYGDAVGAVSAVYASNDIGLEDTAALNAVADIDAAEAGVLLGDGLYFRDQGFGMGPENTVRIEASGSGIVRDPATVFPKILDNMYVEGKLHIRAADHGIHWTGGGMVVGDNTELTITGLTEGTSPGTGIRIRRDIWIGKNCAVTVDARGSAISCRVVTTANPSAPLYVDGGSVVKLSGSEEPGAHVLDCGTKLSGTNNVMSGTGEEWFGEQYPLSELVLSEGAKLTVSGGYLAVLATSMELKSGSELTVTVEKAVDSDDVYEYAAVYLSGYRSYVRDGARFEMEAAGESALYGFTSFYLESDDVYIKAAEEAVASSLSLYRGSDPVIYTFESDDGVNWIPFPRDNSKPYFTTREPASHICAASRPANTYSDKIWTPLEGEYRHSASCIYCGQTILGDCEWDNGSWHYSSGTYTLVFECEICERERASDVEYHSHTFGNWTAFQDEYGQNRHQGFCTVEGCEAETTEYCSNYYGEEYHVGLTTLRRDCEKCGSYSIRELESASSVVHLPAAEVSCSAPGNVEAWICGHCGQYFADENCTQILFPPEVFLSPIPHSYGEDGICTGCGDRMKTLYFVPNDGFPNEDEYYYVIIGKTSDGKLYVMGNAAENGKREAVEIPADMIGADGTVRLTSQMAEFLDREYLDYNTEFTADGGCFSFDARGGIFVYPVERCGDDNLPGSGYFAPNYSGETGSGEMYAYYSGGYNDRVWLSFNGEDLCFEVSETRDLELYLYIQLCEHPDMYHCEAVDPTCTEQGTREYYQCGKCYQVYSDAAGEQPYEFPDYVDPYDQSAISDYFNLPALCHSFNSEDECENCGMKRHVYTHVPSLEAFDELGEEVSFLVVFRDGEKTYALYFPDPNHYVNPCDTDSDGDGLVDVLEQDADGNGIPDCIEDYIDEYWGDSNLNGDGTVSAEEYNEQIGDRNGDDTVDMEDYKDFFECNVYWELSMDYEEEFLSCPNFVEVTVADDGSITVTDEGAMEFQMMESGIWGGQSAGDDNFDEELITEDERLRAAWIPNYWVANDGMMGEYGEGHLMSQYRRYGDREAPGITDNKNWKISFREDGTAILVSTWTDFDDTAQLQLVRYTDENGSERMTVAGCYGERWEYSDILANAVVVSHAYLYASKPAYTVPPHDCEWDDWTPDENGSTHTRRCTVENCTRTQTEDHGFGSWSKLDEQVHARGCSVCGYTEEDEHCFEGDGTVLEEATCFRPGKVRHTCTAEGCDAVRTDEIPMEDHNWGDWTDSGNGEAHSRACRNESCTARQVRLHSWEAGDGEDEGKHVCSDCGAAEFHQYDSNVIQWSTCVAEGATEDICRICSHLRNGIMPIDPDAHDWGEWQVVTPAGEGTEGEERRVCRHAPEDHVETRPIPAEEHEHTLSDWEPLDDRYHRQYCMDDRCAHCVEAPHELAEEVIREPDYGVPGQKRIYCLTCWYERLEEMEPLVCDDPAEGTTSEVEASGTADGAPVDVGAVEVFLPGQGQPVTNDYDKYVLNSMDGYQVEAVYDVFLQEEETPEAGTVIRVTLTVGTENARKLQNEELLLVHVTGVTRDIYSLSELEIDVENGTVTFETDSFSPFVLAAPPAELEITVRGESGDGGCTVTVSANASFLCDLMIAVYDENGRMLAVELVSGCNLASVQQKSLRFSGTAAAVKVFTLESGSGFTPRRSPVEEAVLTG